MQFDEDFEEQLGVPAADFSVLTKFGDIPKQGIVDVSGDDRYGRKVISISACKLPSNKSYDHHLLLQYVLLTICLGRRYLDDCMEYLLVFDSYLLCFDVQYHQHSSFEKKLVASQSLVAVVVSAPLPALNFAAY